VIWHEIKSEEIKKLELENSEERHFASYLNLQDKITMNVKVDA
jgi:tRNA isopentenyl-2-thiomethyl-A-37 hydroxylase MiaE